jgi:hypothetical protein
MDEHVSSRARSAQRKSKPKILARLSASGHKPYEIAKGTIPALAGGLSSTDSSTNLADRNPCKRRSCRRRTAASSQEPGIGAGERGNVRPGRQSNALRPKIVPGTCCDVAAGFRSRSVPARDWGSAPGELGFADVGFLKADVEGAATRWRLSAAMNGQAHATGRVGPGVVARERRSAAARMEIRP